MSLWSMNDGSALSDNITTNGTATVTSAGTSFITDGIRSGDVIVTNGGESLRVLSVDANNSLTLTAAASGSESGVSATLRKPPTNGSAALPDADVFGVSVAEGVAGSDNINSIGVGTTTLGGLDTIGGNTYRGSAPSVTISAPTARTITQANIDEATNVFTATAHGMATGTKLTYTSNGTNIVHNGGTLADGTAVFVIRESADTFKIASSLSNANSGTALDITNDGNDSNSFVGDTATATATISGGKVTGITVTGVGSDYQTTPTVTIAAPSGSGSLNLANGAVLIAADDEIVIPAALYAVISTGEAVTYSDGGGTAPTGLVDGTVYFLIKSATNNRMSLAATHEDALAGTKITLAAGSVAGSAHTFIGGTATGTANRGAGGPAANTASGFHVGWVKRTVGTGGRAGRVQYETLVAASSISGDFEDIAFVEDA